MLLRFINDPNSARSSYSNVHEQTSNTNADFVETRTGGTSRKAVIGCTRKSRRQGIDAIAMKDGYD